MSAIFIERGGDGWYLRVLPGDGHTGRVHVLKRFEGLDDELTLAEIDEVVKDWGWTRKPGVSLWEDDMGLIHVPVSPAFRQ